MNGLRSRRVSAFWIHFAVVQRYSAANKMDRVIRNCIQVMSTSKY